MNSALRVKVHISLNAQQFAPLLLGIEAFTYLPAVGVTAVTPAGGPLDGGTRVRVDGNFSRAAMQGASELLRCRFGVEVVRASREGDGALRCDTPTAPHYSQLWAERQGRSGWARDLHASLQPLSDWQLGETTRHGNAFFAQDAAVDLTLRVDRGEPQGVEVSFNGQDYTEASGVFWRWLLPARALAISPSSGPVHGSTLVAIRGEHLWHAPDLRCRFGDIVVNATVGSEWYYVSGTSRRDLEVHCRSPGSAAANPQGGAVPLALSLNAQEYFHDGLNFSYHLNPPAYAPLHPSFGPLHGGTLAVLPGSYRFGTDRVCRIGGATGQRVAVQLAPRREISISRSGHKLREAPWGPGEDGDFAARLDAAAAETAAAAAAGGQEELLCEMPSVPTPGDTTVELSLNGQQYLGSSDGFDQRFTYHSPMRTIGVAPSSGPAAGKTDILLRLDNVSLSARQLLVELTPEIVCRFGDIWHRARLDEPPPALGNPSNATPVFGPNQVHANLSSHYSLPAINATCGVDGPGGATQSLMGDTSIQCTDELQMLTLRCRTPTSDALAQATLRPEVTASLNAQDFAWTHTTFQFYQPPHVSTVQPTTGPRDGGTLLTVRGSALYGSGEFLLCRFDIRVHGTPTYEARRRSLVALSQNRPPLLVGRPCRGGRRLPPSAGRAPPSPR